MLLSAANRYSFLKRLFVNEFDECSLYCEDLSNPHAVEWLETESAHLLKAAELLSKYEHTPWQTLIARTDKYSNRAAIVKLPPPDTDFNRKRAIDRAADIFDILLNGE